MDVYSKEVKMKYYEMLSDFAEEKDVKVLMRRVWVNSIIRRVRVAEAFLELDSTVKIPRHVKEALDSYKIVRVNNQEQLMSKAESTIIIPFEDSFEVVLKAHIFTNHGNVAKMKKWLSDEKYKVPMICAPVMYSVCHVCLLENQNSETGPPNYEDSGLISFVDMTHHPDKSFRYLLVYQDLETKFLQLRAITGHNLVEEIAMELIRIFTDFSPPQTVVVKEDMRSMLKLVLGRLNVVFEPKILLVSYNGNDGVTSEVGMKLMDWMKSHVCHNWAIGCHIVQWEMNNTRTSSETPYEKFFGRNTPYIRDIYNTTGSEAPEQSPDKDPAESRLQIQSEDIEPINVDSEHDDSEHDGPDHVNPDVGPTHVKPMQISPTHVTSVHVGPSHVGPTHVGPSHVGPTHVGPSHVRPTHVGPEHVGPVHVSPISFGPKTIDPRNIETQENDSDVIIIKSESDEEKDKTCICCICNTEIKTQVYYCCTCNKSLHLYCGARRQGANNVTENICFLCV